MKKLFNPETVALNLATLGYFGKNYFSRIFAPLLAVFMVALGRSLYCYSKDLFYIPLILGIVGVIWIVNFAYENLPLERHAQIVLPLVPGMATALLHLPLNPTIIIAAFILFWIVYASIDFLVEKAIQADKENVNNEDELDFAEEEDEEELEETQAFILPSNKQKSVYEILLLPIGAGTITAFLIHAALLIAKRL